MSVKVLQWGERWAWRCNTRKIRPRLRGSPSEDYCTSPAAPPRTAHPREAPKPNLARRDCIAASHENPIARRRCHPCGASSAPCTSAGFKPSSDVLPRSCSSGGACGRGRCRLLLLQEAYNRYQRQSRTHVGMSNQCSALPPSCTWTFRANSPRIPGCRITSCVPPSNDERRPHQLLLALSSLFSALPVRCCLLYRGRAPVRVDHSSLACCSV